jgi:hypothetical protein
MHDKQLEGDYRLSVLQLALSRFHYTHLYGHVI